MWKPNSRIGFDDRMLRMILIPLTAFLIPIVFFGVRFARQPQYHWLMFVNTLITTFVIWTGCRYIMIWSRRRYPQFPGFKKRLLIQSLLMLIFATIATNTLGYFLHDFCGMTVAAVHKGQNITDVIINSNNASLFCTITMGAIYESKYLGKKLQESLQQQELLKRESLNAQLNALKTQVNPHFLFNNLNTLVALIPDNPQQAVVFAQQLSRVYRHILELKDERTITLKEELEVLEAYSYLLQTRFGSNLQVNIDVPAGQLNNKVVPLSLQLLMENAIKHNIVSADKPLQINVYANNGALVMSNNLQKKNQLSESTGIGLENIKNRYKLLTNRLVEVIENNQHFTVSIPLIAN